MTNLVPLDLYSTVNASVSVLAPFINSVKALTYAKDVSTLAGNPLDILGKVIKIGLLPALDPLYAKLADIQSSQIAFGPNGIQPLYKCTEQLRLAFQTLPSGIRATNETVAAIKELLIMTAVFDNSVSMFHIDIHRNLYDPKGFREFSIALEEKHALLPEADLDSRLKILDCLPEDRQLMTSSEWVAILKLDFEDLGDSTKIKYESLQGGSNGLQGLQRVFFEVIDEYDYMSWKYGQVLTTLEHFASVLAEKLNSLTKKDGKAKQRYTRKHNTKSQDDHPSDSPPVIHIPETPSPEGSIGNDNKAPPPQPTRKSKRGQRQAASSAKTRSQLPNYVLPNSKDLERMLSRSKEFIQKHSLSLASDVLAAGKYKTLDSTKSDQVTLGVVSTSCQTNGL
ncbi:hypothetical protein FRC03_006805 [Tulasnella sp. 419]|nr:hypothetical protein FRC03_006805 [Tulasnella sp. 419]